MNCKSEGLCSSLRPIQLYESWYASCFFVSIRVDNTGGTSSAGAQGKRKICSRCQPVSTALKDCMGSEIEKHYPTMLQGKKPCKYTQPGKFNLHHELWLQNFAWQGLGKREQGNNCKWCKLRKFTWLILHNMLLLVMARSKALKSTLLHPLVISSLSLCDFNNGGLHTYLQNHKGEKYFFPHESWDFSGSRILCPALHSVAFLCFFSIALYTQPWT